MFHLELNTHAQMVVIVVIFHGRYLSRVALPCLVDPVPNGIRRKYGWLQQISTDGSRFPVIFPICDSRSNCNCSLFFPLHSSEISWYPYRIINIFPYINIIPIGLQFFRTHYTHIIPIIFHPFMALFPRHSAARWLGALQRPGAWRRRSCGMHRSICRWQNWRHRKHEIFVRVLYRNWRHWKVMVIFI